ncbi:MAG: hypothetical protein J5U16_03015, partial [Candidatus Methanoperedens sp.]|nr:hypothetical protein [Candidatus Methanoperedens sp.]
LGRRMLPEGGRIVVFSDFISQSGDDPMVAKKLAEANGINVDFVTITGRTDNVGIVNGWFEAGKDYRVIIKNFNKEPQDVKVDVTTNDKNVLSDTRNIRGQTSDYIAISDLAPGITKISLDVNDALPVDNNAYVYIPSSEKQDILYITDNLKSPSVVALGLIPLTTVKKTDTKSIPSLSGYGTVFVGSSLPADAAKSLSDYVKSGGNAVIIASPGLSDMEMLPVELDSISNATSLNVAQASMITDGIGIENTGVKKHFKAKLKRGAVSLVEGGDTSVMLAFWKFGKGLVIYSGLSDPQGINIYDPLNDDVWNDFHANPEYPLFWKQMLEWISGSLDVSEYNAKTGMFIKLPATETVKTPGDTVTTDMLLLDEVGIYDLPDKEVAVNLYDERESNLEGGGISTANATDLKEIPSGISIVRKPKDLVIYLIIAAMFLVVFELYYLHWRGEL